MKPFVVAGGIVRNRAWVLTRHLEAVALCSPAQMFYVFGDCKDETELIFRGVYLSDLEPPARYVERESPHNTILGVPLASFRHDTGEPGYTRDGSDGPRYRSAHMAAERNLWAEEALKRWPQATHLWVVDSDVLPEADVLDRLLALKAPVAGAYVPLADGITPIHMIGYNTTNGYPKRTGEECELSLPHAVTLVGGCYLIEANCFFGDPPWGEHALGEDGHFAEFMQDNIRMHMLVDPLAKCKHIMKRDDR